MKYNRKNPRKYSVDLGTWEKGINIVFSAKDDDAAIIKAMKLSKKEDKMIVQIHEIIKGQRKVFYDFMNGKYNREV